MSADTRYLKPRIPDEPFPGVVEAEERQRMREVLTLVHRRVEEIPKLSSRQKNVFGSAENYPSNPFRGSGEVMDAGVIGHKMDYPDDPIFPEKNGLVSPMGDWNRQEQRQYSMNYALKATPYFLRQRYDEHAPVGIF